MRLIAIGGWSGSGKTTLIEQLIPCLVARGMSVSTIKHAHHAFDVDTRGKDSWRHREAGAQEVIVASAARFALMRENRRAAEPELSDLCRSLAPVDVVLVEGFKRTAIPKLEVHRQETGKPLLQPDDPWIFAIAADYTPPGATVPVMALSDVGAIAENLEAFLRAGSPAPLGTDLPESCAIELSVTDAANLIDEKSDTVCGVERDRLSLHEALGRILATDIGSLRDLPGSDCSAVDGYAIAHADLIGNVPTSLKLAGRAAAGRLLEGRHVEGAAIRIFTGAAMPVGTDTVVMQEHVTLDGDTVIIPADIAAGANRRPRGEDARVGDRVLTRGTRLTGRHVALASAAGYETIAVLRRLRVALFSTGDEIFSGAVADANKPMLGALLASAGAIILDRGMLPDDPAAVRAALMDAASEVDLVITTGGVSVGEEDHVRAAVEAIGQLHLWRVAMKPGRPIAFGRIGKAFFLGLPGSPAAAFIGYLRFGRPLVAKLSGQTRIDPQISIRASFPLEKKPGRSEFVRARIVHRDGEPMAEMVGDQSGAGRLVGLAQTDAIVEIGPEVTKVSAGDIVHAILLTDATG